VLAAQTPPGEVSRPLGRPGRPLPCEHAIGSAIALFAVAGLATQIVAIATGRDFVFGVVPKLNPMGSRNLQVWFGSVMFICCAMTAVVAALQVKPRREGSEIGWWVAAGSLALLSVERMASISNVVVPEGWPAVPEPELYLAVATALFAFGALAAAERALPADVRRRLGWSTAVFLVGAIAFGGAVGQSPDSVVSRIAHVVLVTAGRVMELAGLATFLVTMLAFVGADTVALRPGAAFRWPPARSVDRALNAGIVLVLLVSLASVWARWTIGPGAERAYRLLFVDFEGNLPTWISSTLLFAGGLVASLHAATRRHDGDRTWVWWLMLGAVLAALSADEAASLHELIVFPLRRVLGGSPWLRYPIILPGIVALAVATAFFRRFVATLPRPSRRALLTGATVFVIGALGVETIAGWFDPELYGQSLIYVVLATLEEGLEFFGIKTLLVGLIQHTQLPSHPLARTATAPAG
jgi:hypothetical protein